VHRNHLSPLRSRGAALRPRRASAPLRSHGGGRVPGQVQAGAANVRLRTRTSRLRAVTAVLSSSVG
jgi:hypothetical protein